MKRSFVFLVVFLWAAVCSVNAQDVNSIAEMYIVEKVDGQVHFRHQSTGDSWIKVIRGHNFPKNTDISVGSNSSVVLSDRSKKIIVSSDSEGKIDALFSTGNVLERRQNTAIAASSSEQKPKTITKSPAEQKPVTAVAGSTGQKPETAVASAAEQKPETIIVEESKDLRAKFAWLNKNAKSGVNYVLNVKEDSSLGSIFGNAVNLTFTNKKDITITLRGVGGRRMITSYQKSGIFTVGSGVTFILDNDIFLEGVASGSAIDKLDSVVQVNSGGTFIMNDGSGVGGNMSYKDGGGVRVSSGGTFIMNGGLIAGNSCFQIQDQALVMSTSGKANTFSETPRRGGGVYVDVGGTFTKTGGTITGYASDPQRGNVTKSFNNISVSQNNGHAVFAVLGKSGGIFGSTVTGSKRKETSAGPDANLHISSNGTFSGDWDY